MSLGKMAASSDLATAISKWRASIRAKDVAALTRHLGEAVDQLERHPSQANFKRTAAAARMTAEDPGFTTRERARFLRIAGEIEDVATTSMPTGERE